MITVGSPYSLSRSRIETAKHARFIGHLDILFSADFDSTRFFDIHCWLYPASSLLCQNAIQERCKYLIAKKSRGETLIDIEPFAFKNWKCEQL